MISLMLLIKIKAKVLYLRIIIMAQNEEDQSNIFNATFRTSEQAIKDSLPFMGSTEEEI